MTRGFITTISPGLPGKWFLVASTASLKTGAISPSFINWNEFQDWWWPMQQQIVAVGYSCNVWRAAYAKELFALQTCSFFSTLITARGYIQNQQNLGLRVSSLAHGNDHWFVVMSKGGVMPTSLQGIETSPNVSDFVLSLQQAFQDFDRLPTSMAYGEGQWVAVWSCLKDMPGINPILTGASSGGSSSSGGGGAGRESPRTLKFIILQRSSQSCVVLNALEDGYSILSVASSPVYTLVALIKPHLFTSQVVYHCSGSTTSNDWIVSNISDRGAWLSQCTLDSSAHSDEFHMLRNTTPTAALRSSHPNASRQMGNSMGGSGSGVSSIARYKPVIAVPLPAGGGGGASSGGGTSSTSPQKRRTFLFSSSSSAASKPSPPLSSSSPSPAKAVSASRSSPSPSPAPSPVITAASAPAVADSSPPLISFSLEESAVTVTDLLSGDLDSTLLVPKSPAGAPRGGSSDDLEVHSDKSGGRHVSASGGSKELGSERSDWSGSSGKGSPDVAVGGGAGKRGKEDDDGTVIELKSRSTVYVCPGYLHPVARNGPCLIQ